MHHVCTHRAFEIYKLGCVNFYMYRFWRLVVDIALFIHTQHIIETLYTMIYIQESINFVRLSTPWTCFTKSMHNCTTAQLIQAEALEKELKKNDPDPNNADLKKYQKQLNASWAEAMNQWRAAESTQPKDSWFGKNKREWYIDMVSVHLSWANQSLKELGDWQNIVIIFCIAACMGVRLLKPFSHRLLKDN